MPGSIATTEFPRNKKKLTGREPAAWIAPASTLTKLCIAAAVMAGEIDITDLTITQVARMFGLKPKQIKAIAQLTPEQRAALTEARRLNSVGRFSDEMLDALVAQVGHTRLWTALDRATAPHRVAAE
jgi:hypothetical protein